MKRLAILLLAASGIAFAAEPSEYAGWIIEGTSNLEKPARTDGWIYKELDTGAVYIRRGGEWVNSALALAFTKPTKSGIVTTGPDGTAAVTFNTPFAVTDYTVAITPRDPGGNDMVIAYAFNLTVSGFSVKVKEVPSGNGEPGITCAWLSTLDNNP
jgi:hypothetical protein